MADEPPHPLEPRDVIAAGSRRVRWRTGGVLGAAALATVAAVVVTAVVSRSAGPDPAPALTRVVRLDLAARPTPRLDVLASTRAAVGRPDGSDDFVTHDRFEGPSPPTGWCCANRHRSDRPHRRRARSPGPSRAARRTGCRNLGRTTGTASRVAGPRRPTAWCSAVGQGLRIRPMVVFDRATRPVAAERDRDPGRHRGARPSALRRSEPGRTALYLGSMHRRTSRDPMRLVVGASDGRQAEAACRSRSSRVSASTWGDGTHGLTADPDGRVVLTSAEGSTVVAERAPTCGLRADLRTSRTCRPWSLLAGDDAGRDLLVPRPARSSDRSTAPTRTPVGRSPECPPGLARRTTSTWCSQRHASTLGAVTVRLRRTPARTYRPRPHATSAVGRVGRGATSTRQVAVAAGLLLWNAPGPGDTDDARTTWSGTTEPVE